MSTFLVNLLDELIWSPIERPNLNIKRRNPLILNSLKYYQTINSLNDLIYIFFRFEFVLYNKLKTHGLYYYPNIKEITILNKSHTNKEECLKLEKTLIKILKEYDIEFYEYIKLKEC